MTNLELAGKLQASSARNDDLVDLLWDAGAALRNLHTENTALRATEDNLRQELQECQDQRRAAFRRIEELDAMRAQIGQGVPEIDYEALIAAAYSRDRKWVQGTNGCVAFKCGAEWFRSQMLASAPPALQQKPLTDEQKEVIAFLCGEAPLDGVWFGENHYARHGKYWWRHHLVNAFGSYGGIKGEKK